MKKTLLALIISAGLLASTTHSAKVVERLSSGGYTYMKVEDAGKSYWIAMTQRDVGVGEMIKFTEQGWMQNFHSKTLNRTFESILFAGSATEKSVKEEVLSTQADIMNSSFKEKGTLTVAELFKNRKAYEGKIVTVKGKVSKTSQGIMRLNWVHIQDGSRFKGMNDLVFTSTQAVPNNGDIIYAKGKVVVDKDFGYGYFYPLIIQDAAFSK